MPTPPKRTGGVLVWSAALLFPFALFATITLPGGGDGNLLQLPLAALALLLPLGLARRSPLAGLLVLLAGGTAVLFLVQDETFGRILILVVVIVADGMAGHVAATRPRRLSLPAAALTAVVQGNLALTIGQVDDVPTVLTVILLGVITAWVIGDSIRQRRRHAATQREQAEARAVEAERLRIARELHDMVAHSIAVIAVQAGMGRRVIDTQPAEARNALANIEDTSRETAAALRRMLVSLRRSDGGSAPAPRDPAPGLADLDDLVTRSAQAGVEIRLRRHGDRAPLPPDIDLSAYRIVQEAVTNVIRHAGTGHCDVGVQQDGRALTIEVTDDGPGTGVPAVAGSGNGLTGMRERVSLLGGEFASGPRPGGGFRIAATIPLPETTR
ncbi:sensor histidine kinase [Actinoplanes lobatus]|uniref:Oxygen sensor histidine kinase NreB n=1 Tax=Actinoplanes lobatus TaxID=113568 RepID=A0A7W7HN87_9ACTN|nr:sensor histidine kinase [Actinoplanes lobatus]MBB4753337.1 signal transduction histidine kinase [Actinoplanes lobatus]